MQFFCGNGYSEEFTRNMTKVIESINSETMVHVTIGQDMLCEYCPNLIDGICVSQGKVADLDSAVAEVCGFESGDTITAHEFLGTAKERIIMTEKFDLICYECEWNKICKKVKQKILDFS